MWVSQSGIYPEVVISWDKVGIIIKKETHKYPEKPELLKIIYEQKLKISWKVALEAFNILWEYKAWEGV